MFEWYHKLNSELRWILWLWIVMLGMVCWEQSHWWRVRDDYLFGSLALPFAIFVLSERWGRIWEILQFEGGNKPDKYAAQTFWIAISVFLGALLVFSLGALILWSQGHSQPASLLFSCSFAAIVFSTIWLFAKGKEGQLLGYAHRLELMSLFAFPALVWLLSTPVLSFLERQISLMLLRQVITVVFTIFEVMGLFVEQRGNTLLLPNGVVGVADACSGIRSLMACVFAGSFLGAVFFKKFWKKLLFVGLACLFAFVFNIGRSLFLTFWAYQRGADSIKGSVHDVTGFAVLGLTGLCLLALVPLVEGRWIRD